MIGFVDLLFELTQYSKRRYIKPFHFVVNVVRVRRQNGTNKNSLVTGIDGGSFYAKHNSVFNVTNII